MSDVSYSGSGGVAVITFNRPKANGYDLAFHQAFGAAIRQANADPQVRAVIVRSALERFFCAGADIKVFAASSTEENRAMVDQARANLAAMEAGRPIFIAEINGHALGGGLEIALGCDLRFGGEGDWQLGLPEVKLGLTPGNGGSQRLARLVGMSKALELCVSGESIGPQEAFRIGLLNRLYPADAVEQETLAFARGLAAGAPLAIAALKKGIRAGMEQPLAAGLELEAELVEPLYETADAAEGFRAISEKRVPDFTGS